MASAASRASTLTTLVMGKVEMAIGLFPAHADPKKKLIEFDTAGPNGGELMAELVADARPVEETVEMPDEPVRSDPLDDGPPIEMLTGGARQAVVEQVAGEYKRQLVEKGTGEVVERADVRRGVRLEDGRFIDCSEQLAAIDTRTKIERIEIVTGGFIDANAVTRARVKNAYYVGATDENAPKAMRLLYEAMKAERRAAVVKLTKRSRQSLGLLVPLRGVLMLLELVWAEDFREPPARALAIQKASVSEAQVAMARELVRSMSGSLAILQELRDDAIALREELYAKALAGEVAQVVEPVAVGQDDDVMAQLEASLEAVGS